MTRSETPTITQVEELLAHNGYEVAEEGENVLRVRDLETGVPFRAALEGNVLFMAVNLMSVPASAVKPELMRKMLAADNGISTSSFQLYETSDGKVAVTLNNYCTLQNMGPEDHEDILSIAGYLMADLVEARELLEPMVTTR